MDNETERVNMASSEVGQHFELLKSWVLAGFTWREIAAKLAKETGVKATANSIQLVYARRKARIERILKKEAEEVALREALARAKALEDMKARGRALEAVSVAHSAANSVALGIKPTQSPASRQAEKAATPQVDSNAIFASALESLESQKSARIIR